MENKEKEVKNNNQEEKKVVKLKSLNLDHNQLLIEDDKLKALYSKRYDELTEEDINLIPVFKAKVEVREKIDRYTQKKVKEYYSIVLLCDGVTVEKKLSEQDVLSIQNFNPDLITDGSSKVYVPVKLTSFMGKNGRKFKYLVLLSPGVFMGTTSPENNKSGYDTGYLHGSVLNNLIANNLHYKSNQNRQVRFVKTDIVSEENALTDIMIYNDIATYDSF